MLRRGSRKHILDWVESPTFDRELEALLQPVDVSIPVGAKRMPTSHKDATEARLETFGPKALPSHSAWRHLLPWWLKHAAGANTPNWDLAVTCDIDGWRGFCLVEAKANVRELSRSGKALGAKASPNSKANHVHIAAALRESAASLTRAGFRSEFSVDKSYQLANRIACATQLATWGIPVVLVYLGFLGDTGIRDVGEPLIDAAHWDHLFAEHLWEIAPGIPPNGRVNIGAGFWVLSRSRPVMSISPANDKRPSLPHSPKGAENVRDRR